MELYSENRNFVLNDDGLPLDDSGNIFEDYIIENGFIAQEVIEIDDYAPLVENNDNKKDTFGKDRPWSLRYNCVFVSAVSQPLQK